VVLIVVFMILRHFFLSSFAQEQCASRACWLFFCKLPQQTGVTVLWSKGWHLCEGEGCCDEPSPFRKMLTLKVKVSWNKEFEVQISNLVLVSTLYVLEETVEQAKMLRTKQQKLKRSTNFFVPS